MKLTAGKKKLLGILIALLSVTALTAGCIAVRAARNRQAAEVLLQNGLRIAEEQYPLTKYDAGEFADMKCGLMKLHADQYRAEGLGNLAVITADSGIKQQISFVITPFEKNMPLCTLDFVYVMGNRRSSAAFYGLVGDTAAADYTQAAETIRKTAERYADLPDQSAEPHWYDSFLCTVLHKKLKRSSEDRNAAMFRDLLHAYIGVSAEMQQSTPEAAARQFEITQNFSSGLIEKGGASADWLKKQLGAEQTQDFFDSVIFGTVHYRKTEQ